VEVMPNLDDDIEVNINPEDIRMDVYKSSGAGGQHVQKNATAVRLVHIPTGIVVTCQNERSQMQNREMAMRILRGRLYELERQKREEEAARLKGEHIEAGWGNQIRSYVLHPYKMVKDHRTNYEVGNAEAVLDGHIDGFIEAYLRHVAVRKGYPFPLLRSHRIKRRIEQRLLSARERSDETGDICTQEQIALRCPVCSQWASDNS
jgi:peptide chain release factor 2